MRQFVCFICYFAIINIGCSHIIHAQTQVASRGETLVSAIVRKTKVLVKIKTHEIDIGKPSDQRPSEINSSCTYSKYPCSIVDRLDILIDGNALFIPRSAYCDLADLNYAEVYAIEEGAALILYGADASESYIVKIEFNTEQVKRRTFSGAMSPDQPLQETI